MLQYIEDSREENATDKGVERLSAMVETVKRDKEVGEKYMRLEIHDLDVRNAALKEDRESGSGRWSMCRKFGKKNDR